MTKDEVLKYIELKGDSKFIIRTEEEDLSFLNNYGQGIKERTEAETVTKIHNNYDNDIFEVTGLRRDPKVDVKTFDFNKKLLSEYKSKAEKASIYEQEIANLKKQLKDGTGDKKTHDDLEAVQTAYRELQETKEKEINALKSDYDKYKIRTEIMSAMAGMAFKKGIPETVVNAYTNQVINELTGMASYQDGKLVFMENGIPKRNAFNSLNPYTARELLEEKMKDIRDTGKPATGGPNISNEIVKEYDKASGKVSKVGMVIPDSVRNKQDLSKHLVGQGLLRGSEEYNLAYKEYSQSLPFA